LSNDQIAHRQIRYVLGFLICLVANIASSQIPPRGSGNTREPTFTDGTAIDTNRVASLDSLEVDSGPDTTIYNSVSIANPFVDTPHLSKSLTDLAFYNPNESWGNLNISLGNMGSSTMPIALTTPENTVATFGFGNTYNPYFFTKEKYTMMSINRPFSEVYFSPFQGEANFIAKGKLSQNIGKLSNFTIDFQRYTHKNYYEFQSTRISSVATSYWVKSKSKNYQGIFSYFGRFADENANGGVQDIDDFLTISAPIGIPVNISDGVGRFHDYALHYDQHLKFDKGGNSIHLHNTTSYTYGLSKYSDNDTDSTLDTLVYKAFNINPNGLRNYNRFNHLENTIRLHTTLFDLLEATGYLGYHNFKIKYDQIEVRSVDQIVLGLKGGIKWKENIDLIGTIETSTIGNTIYNFTKVETAIKIADWLNLQGSIYRKTFPTAFNMDKLYILKTQVYSNDFLPQSDTGLDASIDIRPSKTRLNFKVSTLGNTVYYDSNATPQQYNQNIARLQLSAQQNIKVGAFHLDNTVFYQNFDTNIWHLPTLYTQHDLYAQGYLFDKHLLARFGVYYRYYFSESRLAYNPLNQAIYPIDGEGPMNFPRADLYAVFGIQSFHAFFRYENTYSLITSNKEMQIYGYPAYDAAFRMGVQWTLKD
jgi:hypothetical protein